MSKSHGDTSHSRASVSPALIPAAAAASKDLTYTPSEDVNTTNTSDITSVQFCSAPSIFNPTIERVTRHETDLPDRLSTPLILVTLPEDQQSIQHVQRSRHALKTSIPAKQPVQDSKMGNIFGSKKKKKKHAKKEEDGEIWKKMGTNDSSSSVPIGQNKQKKKKKEKKSKRVGSSSPSRSGEESLKGKNHKRYAMYEPQSDPKGPQVVVRSRTLPTRMDPSEFRKSIGDPMDFRMADDVSSAGSPGQATPETPTPPIQKSPVPIYKKIHLNRDKKDKSLPNTPKMIPKDYSTTDAKAPEKRKHHMAPVPGTGSPRPRGYILPSPPSRPKFHATEPGSASPRLLRVQKPVTLNTSSNDFNYSKNDKVAALRARPIVKSSPQPLDPVIGKVRTRGNNVMPAPLITCTEATCVKRSAVEKPVSDDIAMQKENEENERNFKREERRKMATVSEIKPAPKREECHKIQEIAVEAIEPHINEAEKHEIASGPKVAVLSTIPPPEKAVLSHVPPPSPNAMDALCEEHEEDEEDNDDDHVTMRKSKEVEEFGGIVCQRLSQLLESQDDGTLRLQFVESSGPSSSLSPASPSMVMSGGSDVDRERMEDAGHRFQSLSPPVETENVYKEKVIPRNMLCVNMAKPSTLSQRLERSSISTRSTQGSNSASDLDVRIDPSDLNSRSIDSIRDRRENESDISSSDEESSYVSESDYSDDVDDQGGHHSQVVHHRENEYSIPWDLQQYPRTGSYTSDGIAMSDDLYSEREYIDKSTHTPIAHAQRISRHGLKRGENVISDRDDCSDGMWDYPNDKYQKLNKNQQASVEELRIQPINVKRQLFELPTKLRTDRDNNEIVEDEIKPAFVASSENVPKRGSEMMSDVIDAYTSEELANMKRKSPIVPPKRQSTLSEEIIIEQPTNPSALDKSLMKIFDKNEEIDEKYPELAPLHSLIMGVEEGGAPSEEPFFDFRPGRLPTFTRVPFGSRRSLACSESDLDMSEQRDDASSDNMDADDEDDEDYRLMRLGETGDGEGVYGPTYNLESRVEVKVSHKVINTAFRESDDNDSVFLEDDSDDDGRRRPTKKAWTRPTFDIPPPPPPEFDVSPESPPLCPPRPPPPPSPSPSPQHVSQSSVDLASTYNVIGSPSEIGEVVLDDARKQMEDIQKQLQTLRDQMVHMEEDVPGSPGSRSRRAHGPVGSCRESGNMGNVLTD